MRSGGGDRSARRRRPAIRLCDWSSSTSPELRSQGTVDDLDQWTCAEAVRGASAPAPGLVFTLTTTDMPGRSIWSAATSGGTLTRTGRRCTVLVELPVALSGSSNEKTAPQAAARARPPPAPPALPHPHHPPPRTYPPPPPPQ